MRRRQRVGAFWRWPTRRVRWMCGDKVSDGSEWRTWGYAQQFRVDHARKSACSKASLYPCPPWPRAQSLELERKRSAEAAQQAADASRDLSTRLARAEELTASLEKQLQQEKVRGGVVPFSISLGRRLC